MRLSALILLASLTPAAAFAQNGLQTPPPAGTAATSNAVDASAEYAALKDAVARLNKSLTEQVTASKALLKKNQDLLKEAQKMNAANQKLAEEQKRMEAAEVELTKQRDALKAAQKSSTEVASR